jgi:hypothetical protein
VATSERMCTSNEQCSLLGGRSKPSALYRIMQRGSGFVKCLAQIGA